MKLFLPLITIALFSVHAFAQSKPTTEDDYNTRFQFAVTATNVQFPFTHTVRVERFENGNSVFSDTEVAERQAAGVQRITRTVVKNGKRTVRYQISPERGQVYCSEDGVAWTGPQRTECALEVSLYLPRRPETSTYSMEDKAVDRKPIKIYREYLIYPAKPGTQKKEFQENIATYDPRGYFISITTKEGTLTPETVTQTRAQTWDLKTKLKPITPPK